MGAEVEDVQREIEKRRICQQRKAELKAKRKAERAERALLKPPVPEARTATRRERLIRPEMPSPEYENTRSYAVFTGSEASETRRFYKELEGLGWDGCLAAMLMRTQKASSRAKVYRGRSYKERAYVNKQRAIWKLVELLSAPECTYRWGWGDDLSRSHCPHVLYVDLPDGQVSFHSLIRGDGPDYPGKWDGVRDASAARIIRFSSTIYPGGCPVLKAE
jgi:hypothetical protein